MYIQALLTAAAILCMFPQVFANNITTPTQLVQIKDIICALLLSGAPMDEFDDKTVKTLQKYNVNLENMNEQEIDELCSITTVGETAVSLPPEIKSDLDILSEMNSNRKANKHAFKTIQDKTVDEIAKDGSTQNSKYNPTIINRITIRNSPESYKLKDNTRNTGTLENIPKKIKDIINGNEKKDYNKISREQQDVNQNNFLKVDYKENVRIPETMLHIREGNNFEITEKIATNNQGVNAKYEDIKNALGQVLSENKKTRIKIYIINDTVPEITTETITSTQDIPEQTAKSRTIENSCGSHSTFCTPNNLIIDKNDYETELKQDINQLYTFLSNIRTKHRVIKSIKKKPREKKETDANILKSLLSKLDLQESTKYDNKENYYVEEEAQQMNKDSTNVLNNVLRNIQFNIKKDYDQTDTSASKEDVTLLQPHPGDDIKYLITAKNLREILHPAQFNERNIKSPGRGGQRQEPHKTAITLTEYKPLIHQKERTIGKNIQVIPQKQIITKDYDDDFAVIKIKKPLEGKQYVVDFNLLEKDGKNIQLKNGNKVTVKQITENEAFNREDEIFRKELEKSKDNNHFEGNFSRINIHDLVEQVKTIVLNDLKTTTAATTVTVTVRPNNTQESTSPNSLQFNKSDSNIVIPMPLNSILEMFNILKGKLQPNGASMIQYPENNMNDTPNKPNLKYPYAITQANPYQNYLQKPNIARELKNNQELKTPMTMQTNSNVIPPLQIPLNLNVDSYGISNILEKQNTAVKSFIPNIRERFWTDLEGRDSFPRNHHNVNNVVDNDGIELNFKIKGKSKNFLHGRESGNGQDNENQYADRQHREQITIPDAYETYKIGEQVYKSGKDYGDNLKNTRTDNEEKHQYFRSGETDLKNDKLKYIMLNHDKNNDEDFFSESSNVDDIAKRHQVPMNNINKPRHSTYDDTHFQNFMKTQQKVNDMLELILSKSKKHDLSTIDIEGY